MKTQTSASGKLTFLASVRQHVLLGQNKQSEQSAANPIYKDALYEAGWDAQSACRSRCTVVPVRTTEAISQDKSTYLVFFVALGAAT